MGKRIYLDNAATTMLLPEVLNEMEPYLKREYGNPSTAYELGENARMAVEKARNRIAECIHADSGEIYFTSGGTEADNWALKGIADGYIGEKAHIITTEIEHHAILGSCEFLEKMGIEVTYVKPDEDGIVNIAAINRAIKDNTILISVMHGNNEIGTIQPIDEIGRLAREKGIIFHSDAVQTTGHIPIDVGALQVDMLSASGHKFNGPKGVGFLYVRKGIALPPFMHGGGQEMGVRAGTENVSGIVGMGKALAIANSTMGEYRKKVKEMREYMVKRVLNEIEGVRYNGHSQKRLPGNASFSFRGIDAQMLLMLLAEQGICASAGSACNTDSRKVSHVISAINVQKEFAPGTIRFSIDKTNTMGEIAMALGALKKSVSILRMV